MEARRNEKKFKVEKTPSELPQIPSIPQIPNPQSPISNPQAPNLNPQSHIHPQVPIPKNDKEEKEKERKRKYNEERKKKKEEDQKKKNLKLKKLHDDQKKMRENQKKLKQEQENLIKIYKEQEEEEASDGENNQEVAPVPEYPNRKGAKTMVFGGNKALLKEKEDKEKKEIKQKKRDYVAAKRGLDLEFLLSYYENLRNKEIKIQEEKGKKGKELEKKIKEIGEKYNNRLKNFIGENKALLDVKYDFQYPKELPPYEAPEEIRRAFFSKLFMGKKRAPEVPIQYIVDADWDKRDKKRIANKKYYKSHKKSEGGFYETSKALANFFAKCCENKEEEASEEEEEPQRRIKIDEVYNDKGEIINYSLFEKYMRQMEEEELEEEEDDEEKPKEEPKEEPKKEEPKKEKKINIEDWDLDF